MNTIVISDTHLTSKFDQRKFSFINKLIEQCDKLIVNGDFWSLYSCSFDEFINSRWQELFPLMLEKDTHYIYGNHDTPEYMDKRVSMFSTKQGYKTQVKNENYTYIIEHGHAFFKHKSRSNKNFVLMNRKLRIDSLVRYPIDSLIYKEYTKLSFLRKYINNKIKLSLEESFNERSFHVVGHTHFAEEDLSKNFINTGVIGFGLATYLFIDEHGHNLVTKTY